MRSNGGDKCKGSEWYCSQVVAIDLVVETALVLLGVVGGLLENSV